MQACLSVKAGPAHGKVSVADISTDKTFIDRHTLVGDCCKTMTLQMKWQYTLLDNLTPLRFDTQVVQ